MAMAACWRRIVNQAGGVAPSLYPDLYPTRGPHLVKVGIQEFLNGVGKGVEAHVMRLQSEIGDLNKPLVTRAPRLQKLGIPCKHVKGEDANYIRPPVVWSPALSTRTVVFRSEYSKLNYASSCCLGRGSPLNHVNNCFFGRSLSTSVATDLKPVGEVFKCQHETRGRLCKTLEKRNILDHKRRLLVSKYELRRKLYKAICRDPDLPSDIREKQRCKLGRLPRNSSFVRVRNRCIITGRSHAVLKMFRMSRIVFREKASQGSLMGVKKSSW